MEIPFLNPQLEFIKFIQSFSTPTLDAFFRFLNYFDTEYFAFILVPLVWIGFSWKWGLRLFYLLIISSFLNSFFKNLFELPRPFHLDTSLALVLVKGYGLPSGGAQTALLLGGLLISYWKRPIAWFIGLIYIFTISLSRLYLGVHFPMDVLSGWILGSIILLSFNRYHSSIESTLSSRKGVALAVVIVFPLIGMVIFPKLKVYSILTSAMIGGIGALLSLRYHLFLKSPAKIWKGFARGLVGVIGVFILFFLSPRIFSFLNFPILLLFFQSALITLWMSIGASPFCRLLFPWEKWDNKPV